MPLKELEVRYASRRSKDYKLGDGGGLYLLVRPTGSRLWRMKYRFDGKEKLLSFGRYPEVTLAEARLRRAEAKLALARGDDSGPKAASADSDHRAHVFRSDAAQRSDLIARRWII